MEWKESGSQFSGVIKAINKNGSFDVLYDEKVGGKACLEKQVVPSRIELTSVGMDMETNGDEEHMKVSTAIVGEENIETDYWTDTNVENYTSTTDRSKLVSRLLQVNFQRPNGQV